MKTEQSIKINSKKHFEILDGLRGVAAISVVIFHFMECIITDYSKNFIAHGYLAVDFFFCLSGFVIAYAYQERLATISLKQFVVARLIRLQPMIILGGILGIIAFYIDPNTSYQWNYPIGKVLLMFLATLLVIPNPLMEERFFNNFGFNAPQWSLFWEYIANVAFALWIFRFKNLLLYMIAIVAGIALIYIAINANSVMGGWGLETFWHGGVRLLWSFNIGVLIYRLRWKIDNSLGFLGLSVLLLLCFIYPYKNDSLANSAYEIIAVMLIFPLIIVLGVGTRVSPKIQSICKFSGEVSYPLYMLHYCMIWIFMSYNTQYKPDALTLFYVVSISTIGSIIFSYFAFKYIDEPVRKWLLKRINGKVSH